MKINSPSYSDTCSSDLTGLMQNLKKYAATGADIRGAIAETITMKCCLPKPYVDRLRDTILQIVQETGVKLKVEL